MEFSQKILQNNNHQSVNKIVSPAWWLLFCEKLHETSGLQVHGPWGRRSMALNI